MADLVTVRIPELPAFSVYGDLTVNDRMPIWMAAYNKTVQAKITDLRSFILTGGGISHPPIITGNAMIVTVSLLEAGGKIFSIPSIAGKDFLLRRAGIGALPLDAYEVLDAGGFKLLRTDDFLNLDEQFEIQFYGSSVSTGTGTGSTPSLAGTLFTGVLSVSANRTLAPSDIGKLVQIRATTTAITLTLPAVETIPENSLIVIETSINNSKKHTIITSGSQNIYFSNASHTVMYIGVGESLVLYRGVDGYYMLPSNGNFISVGDISYGYKIGNNELVLDGSIVNRADELRLFEWAQTIGGSIVTDDDWNSVDANGDHPFQGCFSLGDGTLTFRLPNHLNTSMRSLKTLIGSDTERAQNKPGGYQTDSVGPHFHLTGTETTAAGAGFNYGAGHIVQAWNITGLGPSRTASTALNAGVETRGKNIGMLPKIKT